MNSKERVLAAIGNKSIDRIPFDFWAEDVIWDKLFKHAGHKSKRKIMDQLHVDVRHVKAIEPAEKPYAEGIVENIWGERFTTKPTEWGLIKLHTEGALFHAKSINDLKNHNWPSNDVFDYSTIKEQCDRNDGYAIFLVFAISGSGRLWSAEYKMQCAIFTSILTGFIFSAGNLRIFIKKIIRAPRKLPATVLIFFRY
jgi:uroporphyrinogen decarboxylase